MFAVFFRIAVSSFPIPDLSPDIVAVLEKKRRRRRKRRKERGRRGKRGDSTATTMGKYSLDWHCSGKTQCEPLKQATLCNLNFSEHTLRKKKQMKLIFIMYFM